MNGIKTLNTVSSHQWQPDIECRVFCKVPTVNKRWKETFKCHDPVSASIGRHHLVPTPIRAFWSTHPSSAKPHPSFLNSSKTSKNTHFPRMKKWPNNIETLPIKQPKKTNKEEHLRLTMSITCRSLKQLLHFQAHFLVPTNIARSADQDEGNTITKNAIRNS